MKTVRAAIIGAGVVGERLFWKFNEHPNVELVALCDPNVTRMKELQGKIEHPLKLYTDYKRLLEDHSIDLFYVGVPPKYHHPIAIDIMKKGKHILCEKPLANSLDEAKEMMDMAKEMGVINGMNFPVPYSDPFIELENRVKNGSIGTVQRVELQMYFPVWPRPWQQNSWIASREQGGFIREITPHYIQLIHRLFGETAEVHSFVNYPDNEELCEKGFIANMTLENGIPVLVNGLSGIGEKESITFKIWGDKGTVALKNWAQLEVGTFEENPKEIHIERNNHQLELVHEFVKKINGEEGYLVTFEDGYKVQKVLEKLLGNES